jgi:hypothetical protein
VPRLLPQPGGFEGIVMAAFHAKRRTGTEPRCCYPLLQGSPITGINQGEWSEECLPRRRFRAKAVRRLSARTPPVPLLQKDSRSLTG